MNALNVCTVEADTDSDEELETSETSVDYSVLKSVFSKECFSSDEDSDSIGASLASWVTRSSSAEVEKSMKKRKSILVSACNKPKMKSKNKVKKDNTNYYTKKISETTDDNEFITNNDSDIDSNAVSEGEHENQDNGVNKTAENDKFGINDDSVTDSEHDHGNQNSSINSGGKNNELRFDNETDTDADNDNGDDEDEDNDNDNGDDEDNDNGNGDDEDNDNGNDEDNDNGDDEDDENPTGSNNEPSNSNKMSSNPSWADAMAKILNTNKPKKKKVLTLSRAKKLRDVKNKDQELDFEIIPNKNVQVDQNKIEEVDVKENKPDIKKSFLIKETYTKGRIKVSVLDKDRERILSKIATRGVVQLFNIVRQQQKSIGVELKKGKKSRRKRENTLTSTKKMEILDTMTSAIKSTPIDEIPIKRNRKQMNDNNDDQSTWAVLKENFMMGNKFKDWDRKENDLTEKENHVSD